MAQSLSIMDKYTKIEKAVLIFAAIVVVLWTSTLLAAVFLLAKHLFEF